MDAPREEAVARTPSAGRADDRRTLSQHVAEWLGLAAGATGLVVIIHLLGGVVMWLRFKKAGLPADQAVALMSREQMMAVGLRLMVLPALASGVLVVLLLAVSGRRRRSGRHWTALRRTGAALLVALVVLLALSVSFSAASATWLALLLVPLYRWWDLRYHRPQRRRPSWALVCVAVLAAAVVSLGRQIDEPVQLLQLTVTLAGTAAGEQPEPGVFVNADSSTVYIGDTEQGTIRGFRRSDVARVELGPPRDRAPSPSLLSRWFSGDRWAVTPLSVWCNGERYTWPEWNDVCRTQTIVHDDHRFLDLGRLPVHLTCPDRAKRRCAGYIRLRTERRYAEELGSPRRRHAYFPHEREPGVKFTVLPGRADVLFCVPTTRAETLALERIALRDRQRKEEIPMRVILSSDPRGENVLREDTAYRLAVEPVRSDPSLIHDAGCATKARAALAERRPDTQRAVTATFKQASAAEPWTVDVRTAGTTFRVRLLGVGDFDTGRDKVRRACIRAQAAAFLERRAAAGRVRVEPDPRRGDRDPEESKLLRYVTPAGEERTLQEDLVREGWAKAVPGTGPPLERWPALVVAAQDAKRAGRGLYSARPRNRLGQTLCPPGGP